MANDFILRRQQRENQLIADLASGTTFQEKRRIAGRQFRDLEEAEVILKFLPILKARYETLFLSEDEERFEDRQKGGFGIRIPEVNTKRFWFSGTGGTINTVADYNPVSGFNKTVYFWNSAATDASFLSQEDTSIDLTDVDGARITNPAAFVTGEGGSDEFVADTNYNYLFDSWSFTGTSAQIFISNRTLRDDNDGSYNSNDIYLNVNLTTGLNWVNSGLTKTLTVSEAGNAAVGFTGATQFAGLTGDEGVLYSGGSKIAVGTNILPYANTSVIGSNGAFSLTGAVVAESAGVTGVTFTFNLECPIDITAVTSTLVISFTGVTDSQSNDFTKQVNIATTIDDGGDTCFAVCTNVTSYAVNASTEDIGCTSPRTYTIIDFCSFPDKMVTSGGTDVFTLPAAEFRNYFELRKGATLITGDTVTLFDTEGNMLRTPGEPYFVPNAGQNQITLTMKYLSATLITADADITVTPVNLFNDNTGLPFSDSVTIIANGSTIPIPPSCEVE